MSHTILQRPEARPFCAPRPGRAELKVATCSLVVTRLLRQPAVPMVDAAIQPNFAGTAAAKSPRHSIEVAIPREDQHALNFKAHAAQVPPDKRLAGGDISNVLFYPCVVYDPQISIF